jgi:protein-tyrosine phosphatase
MYKNLFFCLLLLPAGLAAQIADSSRREVKLAGAANFRDLGGYATADGHHVRWGCIYRSADISKLTPSDLDTLRSRHIQYDVDLRGVQESAQAPDRINPGTDYTLCPAGSDSVNGAMFRRLADVSPAGGDSLMRVFYSNTAYLTPRYKPFFDKLAAVPAGEALLFHCTAGKDRTGIGAALVLYALGVPYATIREDYEATNYYRAKENQRAMTGMVTQAHISEPVARALMSANGAWLDAAFDAIRTKYGSVDLFLSGQLGMDEGKLRLLRAKYLE